MSVMVIGKKIESCFFNSSH